MYADASLIIAIICATVMGFGIQRGSTCIVAAVDESITKRKFNRFLSLSEAALWVAGSIMLWRAFGGEPSLPIGFSTTLSSAAGGAVLGIGALISGACIFGAVARFGSGEWIFILTPIGFFLGCRIALPLIGALPTKHVVSPPQLLDYLLLLPFALLAMWRITEAVHAARRSALAAYIWSPHHATAVIGIAFGVSLLAIGPWAYTYALVALAEGTTSGVTTKLIMLVALLAGAVIGGWAAGRFRLRAPSFAVTTRSFIGGIVMSWGSLLIPGGNDELLLVGIPLLQPYAWIAVFSMSVAIVAGRAWQRRFHLLAEPAGLR